MGFIKQAKADSFASSAKRAAEEGHQVFVVAVPRRHDAQPGPCPGQCRTPPR
jgi:hypothetical protein